MNKVKIVISGVLAGLFIGLGSFAYCGCVALDANLGKILGSVLFSVGLFFVCFSGTCLYTGRIGFAPEAIKEKGWGHLFDLALMLAGNFIGAAGSGALLNLAFQNNANSKIIAIARSIALNRALLGNGSQPWYKAFIMGIFCGILVFLAVYVWKKSDNWFIKATGLIFCVTTFVVTGTEHCVANMFYYAFGGEWNLGDFLDVLIVIAGNSVGSLLVFSLLRIIQETHGSDVHRA
ncbi:MAG: formate/nitrite transporter family protein [Bacilli bacterium]